MIEGNPFFDPLFFREKFNFSGHEDLPSVDHGREVFDVREVAVFSYINKHIFTVSLGYQISGATLWPGKKKQITLRLDPDVVDFFKTKGRGYQSSINVALRRYMEAHQRRMKSV